MKGVLGMKKDWMFMVLVVVMVLLGIYLLGGAVTQMVEGMKDV